MRSSARYTKCAECGVAKSELDLLEQHIKQEHLNEWQPFSCGYCDKRRFTEWQIREHIICHHPHREARIVFTDDETKSTTLSGILARSMENSERHHPRRPAPRVFQPPPPESSGDSEGGEHATDQQPFKTPIIVDITEDDKDKNVVVIDDEYDETEAPGAVCDEQSDDTEQRVDGEDDAQQQQRKHSAVDEITPAVAEDGRTTTPAFPPKRRRTRSTIRPPSASASTPLHPPLKRRASTMANRSLPLTERSTWPEKTKQRRKSTYPLVSSIVNDGDDAPRKSESLTVRGSSSRWWRCKLCKDLASVKMIHVLQKHLSLPVYRCTADQCDYSSHYSIGMVKHHIKSRHGAKSSLLPNDDSAIYQKEIDETFAKCFA